MKLFADLNRYVANRSHYAIPNTELVNTQECAALTFNSLLTMHVLRQESDTAMIIQEYAARTLQQSGKTNLHEFLHVMHTEILREHNNNQHSEFTSTELAVQVRITHEFLQSLAESNYNLAEQNSRLMQLETSYRITETQDRKLRRDVRSWGTASWDVRYKICNKLWENMHAAQGLLDLQQHLRNYIREQKWPVPGSGRHQDAVSASNRMQLINRLPQIKEDQTDSLLGSQAVKQLEQKLDQSTDHSYDAINQMMTQISNDVGITTDELHDAFVSEHGVSPDDWIKGSEQRSMRESATSGGTSSGAVASIANPMGKIARRPNLFGWIPPDADMDEAQAQEAFDDDDSY